MKKFKELREHSLEEQVRVGKVMQFAAKAHELWRNQHIKDKGDVPRVKKNSDGTEGDINVPFHKLHPDWKKENIAAGHAALAATKKHPHDVEKASEHVHNEWMKRNPKADYNANQHKPYNELPEDEKEKDRVHVRAMSSLKKQGNTPKKMAEEVEELDEISTKTLASAAKSASDPESDYYYGKSHDAQKFADHAKKTKDAKSAAAVQGAADAKGHYPRPGHTLGSYDKLAYRSPARVTSAGKANKQDVKSLKSNLRKEEVESVEEGIMNAVKNLAAKAGKALTGGSDEDQRKDLQRKMGVPQTGKKPMQK